jgi:copper chaperone CopZ
METKFETNIKCDGCIAKVTPSLNEAVGENKWKVDLANPSKILTVDVDDKNKIIKALEKVGYNAEPIS